MATEGDPAPMQTDPIADIETLRHKAAALTASYRRAAWVRFVLVFFPVPFVVVLVRLQLESWHYYLAGAAYLGFSLALFVIDSKAAGKCERAQKAVDEARRAAMPVPVATTTPAPARAAGYGWLRG